MIKNPDSVNLPALLAEMEINQNYTVPSKNSSLYFKIKCYINNIIILLNVEVPVNLLCGLRSGSCVVFSNVDQKAISN